MPIVIAETNHPAGSLCLCNDEQIGAKPGLLASYLGTNGFGKAIKGASHG